jgi:hypothetical protein
MRLFHAGNYTKESKLMQKEPLQSRRASGLLLQRSLRRAVIVRSRRGYALKGLSPPNDAVDGAERLGRTCEHARLN